MAGAYFVWCGEIVRFLFVTFET